MNISLRQIKALVTIARVGSFTRAADVLHLSQPALTVQIHQLEEALGVRLLHRTTRAVKLTESGRAAVLPFQEALNGIDAVVERFRTTETTRDPVRVAALPSICSAILPRAIARLRVLHPGVPVQVLEAGAGRIIAAVKSETVDFGIGSLDPPDPGVQATPLMADRIMVVFPAGHPLERRRSVGLGDVVAHPLVASDPNSTVRRMVDSALASLGHHIAPAFEASFVSTAVGMVRAGLGITLISESSLERAVMTGLKARPIVHPGFNRKIVTLRSPMRRLSRTAAALLEQVVADVRGADDPARRGEALRLGRGGAGARRRTVAPRGP